MWILRRNWRERRIDTLNLNHHHVYNHMRRVELIEGVKNITSALERNGVQKALRSMFEGGRGDKDEKENRSSGSIVVALNGYES